MVAIASCWTDSGRLENVDVSPNPTTLRLSSITFFVSYISSQLQDLRKLKTTRVKAVKPVPPSCHL